jgi:hypothetical protein
MCIVATALMGAGCVSPCCKAYQLARDVGPSCEVPTSQRNQVYVFAIGPTSPTGILALDQFRQGLGQQGYAKVGIGQGLHVTWMASEIRRLHKEVPDAVFVVVGSQTGCTFAANMAEKAILKGIPIRGVVMIEPRGHVPPEVPGVPNVVIGTGYDIAAHTTAKPVVISDPCRLGLLADERTVSEVVELLNVVAQGTPPTPQPDIYSPWEYPPAPELRPIIPPGDPAWSFMFDQPGGVTRSFQDAEPANSTTPTELPAATVRKE